MWFFLEQIALKKRVYPFLVKIQLLDNEVSHCNLGFHPLNLCREPLHNLSMRIEEVV
jgi:hypothetical protein